MYPIHDQLLQKKKKKERRKLWSILILFIDIQTITQVIAHFLGISVV